MKFDFSQALGYENQKKSFPASLSQAVPRTFYVFEAFYHVVYTGNGQFMRRPFPFHRLPRRKEVPMNRIYIDYARIKSFHPFQTKEQQGVSVHLIDPSCSETGYFQVTYIGDEATKILNTFQTDDIVTVSGELRIGEYFGRDGRKNRYLYLALPSSLFSHFVPDTFRIRPSYEIDYRPYSDWRPDKPGKETAMGCPSDSSDSGRISDD